MNRKTRDFHNNLMLLICIAIMTFMCGGIADAASWGASVNILGSDAGYPSRPDISSDGTKVVYLNDPAASTEKTKEIRFVEYVQGKWSSPVTLASNGVLPDMSSGIASYPEYTHPVLSGNGNVIAYLGHNQDNIHEVYVIDRTNGVWGAPSLLNAGKGNLHYWLAISYDGNTIVFATYPYVWSEEARLYVSTRTDGAWAAPVQVSDQSGAPISVSIAPEATKIAWIQNYRLVFAEKVDGAWTTPNWLTAAEGGDVDGVYTYYEAWNPKITADGPAIFFWKTKIAGSTLDGKDLYVIKRTGTEWGGPVKITPEPIVTDLTYLASPVATDSTGTRVIYGKGIVSGDVMNSARLMITEYQNGSWTTPVTLTSPSQYYDVRPKLTSDGNTVIYEGPDKYGNTSIWSKSVGSATTETYTLTVSVESAESEYGTGTGKVTATGISCIIDSSGETTGTCEKTYSKPTNVVLKATADSGSKLTGWEGCDSTNTAAKTCTVNVSSSDKTVTATFEPITRYTVTVTKDGNGEGTVKSSQKGIKKNGINCDAGDTDCEETYVEKTNIALVASPAKDGKSKFIRWEGTPCETSKTASCRISKISADVTVTAVFGYPVMTVSEEALDLSSDVTSQTFTITNSGTGALSVTFSTGSKYFKIYNSGDTTNKAITKATVAEGESSDFEVRFTGGTKTVSANLTLRSNDPDNKTKAIALTGNKQ